MPTIDAKAIELERNHQLGVAQRAMSTACEAMRVAATLTSALEEGSHGNVQGVDNHINFINHVDSAHIETQNATGIVTRCVERARRIELSGYHDQKTT